MSDDVIYMVVTVKAVAKEISSDDEGVAGVYAYGFLESEVRKLTAEQVADGLDPFEEHVLDTFHGEIAISELDDFSISCVRAPTFDDIPPEASYEESSALIFKAPKP